MNTLKYAFLLLIAFSLSSCVKNLEQPCYLEINEWKLEANPLLGGAEGELNHNFSDAWVYIDQELVGVFQLPCKIPVAKNGARRITIYPTVRVNGIAGTKKIYPFVDYYFVDVTLVKGTPTQINPITRYTPNTIFSLTEDFESASLKFMNDPTSTTTLQQISHTDLGKVGHCGYIHLTPTDSIWTGNTHSDLVLPSGKEVYLEIEYKTDVEFLSGVLAIDNSNVTNIHPMVYHVPTTQWKKTYVELREIISYSSSSAFFEIYLQTLLPSGATSGNVYIDNIKVIHL